MQENNIELLLFVAGFISIFIQIVSILESLERSSIKYMCKRIDDIGYMIWIGILKVDRTNASQK